MCKMPSNKGNLETPLFGTDTIVQSGDAGFTIVETLVALAILALSLAVLFEVISTGLRQVARAERRAEAGLLVQSVLARVGTEIPLQARHVDGQLANGFRWRVHMEPFGDVADLREWPVSAYRVSAEIDWDDAIQKRSVVLTTIRLGPRASGP